MLYVPASRPDMILKAAASDADAVCIDLEDAVAVDEKPASRANVVRAFKELDFGRKLKAFRINGLDAPFAYRDLIEVVEQAGDRIDVVMMPKAHLPQDVRFVCMLLTQIELAQGFARQIGLEVQIESAKGFMWLREIAEASPRLQALIFGLLVPGIDNYAHLGGFAGGYLTSAFLNPMTRERGDHMIVAMVCLAATLLSIVASIVTGLGLIG